MNTRDWNLCFICQSHTNEAVTDPASSIKLCGQPKKLEASYQELLDNIFQLNELGVLPRVVVLNDIVGGVGNGGGVGGAGGGAISLVELMKTNHTVWHKNCRSAVNKQKVDRAKGKIESPKHQQSPMKTRRMSSGRASVTYEFHTTSAEGQDQSASKCFFCEVHGDEKDLRKAFTLGLNQRVNDTTRKISDVKLQGKLSKGDMIATDAVYYLACLSKLYR